MVRDGQFLWYLWWVHMHVKNMTFDNNALAPSSPFSPCVCVCRHVHARVKAVPPRLLENRLKAWNEISVLEEVNMLLLKMFVLNRQRHVTLQGGLHGDGWLHRQRVRVQLLLTLSNLLRVRRTQHGNSTSFLMPRVKTTYLRMHSYRFLLRVHYRLISNVSKHISKCYIWGGGPPCYKFFYSI